MIVNSTTYPSDAVEQVYNALDCTITFDVFQELQKQLDANTQSVYEFELTLQRVALNIMLRGVRIDKVKKLQKIIDLEHSLVPLQKQFDELCMVALKKKVNENSSPQVQHLFYVKFGLKPIFAKTGKTTADDKAIAKIIAAGGFSSLLARYISAIRKTKRLISTLKSEEGGDGRMRENINITGTETGRWSSSKPLFGGGMSGQNITEKLRDMFVADPHHKFIYIDLDQAESRAVGIISYRESGKSFYLDACESGDIHTAVVRMTWPELEWSEDVAKARERAESEMLNSQFSYRDIAKRVGHGSNYMGTPAGVSFEVKVPKTLIEDFQRRYFRAFPDLKEWHNSVVRKLQLERSLTTLLKRQRYFFGRAYERQTIKEAVAYEPQSLVGDTTNIALMRAQRIEGVSVLKNLHDGALFQVKADRVTELVPLIMKAFEVPLRAKDREIVIPTEVRVGKNWGKFSASNPNGLKLYDTGEEMRTYKDELSILDLRL